MTIAQWQPGTLYLPGATVSRVTTPANVITNIANADFESGDTDWTYDSGFAINQTSAFSGQFSAEYSDSSNSGVLENDTFVPISVGQSVIAKCMLSIPLM